MNEKRRLPLEPLLPDCREILDIIPDGLIVVDRECRIRTWNRTMEQITGWRAEETIGRHCSFLGCHQHRLAVADPNCFECALMKAEAPVVEQVECVITTRDGENVPVLKNARAIVGADGEIEGVIESLTDLRAVRRLEEEIRDLKGVSGPGTSRCYRLVGKSHAMREVYERIQLAAQSVATVLIQGETGSGKELVADAIHQAGERATQPFIKVNCSALSENLLESELFGHVRGAFTGAVADKVGRFEAADGGTLFLDEIGDISPLIQLKLLRVLQEHEFERVGESAVRRVDVRVVAATHRDLRQRVSEGTFREDLYYRIRVFGIGVPPLRERKEDIPLLIESFMTRFNEHTGKALAGVTDRALVCLMDYCWPGNVRELENAVEHAFVTCQGGAIDLFDLPLEIRMINLRADCGDAAVGTAGVPMMPMRRRLTRDRLLEALNAAGWNKAEAARHLGVARTTVWRRMRQWEIPMGDEE